MRPALSNTVLCTCLLTSLCLALCSHHGSTSDSSPLVCKSQGALRLDAPHAPPARRDSLPFCQQFAGCTCCNASHAAALVRALAPALADDALSADCKAVAKRLACRVCDPLVGLGLRQAVCAGLCDAWLAACGDDFFEWHHGELVPCAAAPQRALVCTRLGALAGSGAQLCARAGLLVAAAACYDGGAPRPLESCRTPPARARRRPSAAGVRVWDGLRQVGERLLVAGGVVSAFLIWRAAAARQRSAVRVQPTGAAALPWGAYPGRPRFLNE